MYRAKRAQVTLTITHTANRIDTFFAQIENQIKGYLAKTKQRKKKTAERNKTNSAENEVY